MTRHHRQVTHVRHMGNEALDLAYPTATVEAHLEHEPQKPDNSSYIVPTAHAALGAVPFASQAGKVAAAFFCF